MTREPPNEEHHEDERENARSVRWLERAEFGIFIGLVIVIVLLWLLGWVLGAPWAR